MPEFKLNGKTYSGSTSYASAIDYTEADGSKTTVQDKISEIDSNISEQNKNISGLIGYYNTNDIAVLLSTCTEKVVFFQLTGSSYVGEKLEGNFIYGTGYAIKRDNHYIGEAGYSSKHSFIFKDNTLTFLT